MKFFESIGSFWEKGATFVGTASRSEYWWAQLFLFMLEILLWGFTQTEKEGLVIILFDIVVFLPCLALTVRRFRDIRLPIWIPIALLSLSMVFDVCNFIFEDPGEFALFEFLEVVLGTFVMGTCLAPSAGKPTKKA